MQYAINDATKEHVKMGRGEVGVPNHWRKFTVVTPDSDGFITHDGGECPLPHGDVAELKYLGGTTAYRAHPVEIASWDRIVKYRPILEDKEQEWDGEGLPPVGARFEVVEHEWIDGVLFISAKLRPIRTPAQWTEDEAVDAMLQALGFRKPYDIGVCHKIYAAIREGRIPGVTLTNEEDNHYA